MASILHQYGITPDSLCKELEAVGEYKFTGTDKERTALRTLAHRVKSRFGPDRTLTTGATGNSMFVKLVAIDAAPTRTPKASGSRSRTKAAPLVMETPGDFREGDAIRHVDPCPRHAEGTFIVKSIRETRGGTVEVHCYGGKSNEEAARAFLVERMVRVRRREDIQAEREAERAKDKK